MGCHGWKGALRQSKKSPASATRAFNYARIQAKSTFAAGNAASAACRRSLVRCWRGQAPSPTALYVVTFSYVRSPRLCVTSTRACVRSPPPYVRSLCVPQGDRKGSHPLHTPPPRLFDLARACPPPPIQPWPILPGGFCQTPSRCELRSARRTVSRMSICHAIGVKPFRVLVNPAGYLCSPES